MPDVNMPCNVDVDGPSLNTPASVILMMRKSRRGLQILGETMAGILSCKVPVLNLCCSK